VIVYLGQAGDGEHLMEKIESFPLMRTLRYHEQLDVHATIVSLTSASTGVTVRTASGRETVRRGAIQPEDAPGGDAREQYEGKQVQGFSQR